MHKNGFQVTYEDGDTCYADSSKKYTSTVRYICDPEEGSQNKMNDFP